MDSTPRLADGAGFENRLADVPGIIHDTKNLLCAVIGTAELMSLEIPDEHPYHLRLQTIIQMTQKCIELLLSSHTIESGHTRNFEKIELKPLVDEVVSWISLPKRNKITIESSCDILNPVLYGNKTEIESALMNLCINALEAMPDSGILRINISSATEEIKQTHGNPNEISQQKFVKLEISDTGVGIAPEKIPYIFNPFYSTKQTTGPSQRGMGLFRAKRCICTHGGTIEVSSTPFAGTTFTIMLPGTGIR